MVGLWQPAAVAGLSPEQIREAVDRGVGVAQMVTFRKRWTEPPEVRVAVTLPLPKGGVRLRVGVLLWATTRGCRPRRTGGTGRRTRAGIRGLPPALFDPDPVPADEKREHERTVEDVDFDSLEEPVEPGSGAEGKVKGAHAGRAHRLGLT